MNETTFEGCKIAPRNLIKDCNLTGVEFTKGATDSIMACAKALEANARACEANARASEEFARIMNMTGMTIPLINIHGDKNTVLNKPTSVKADFPEVDCCEHDECNCIDHP